MSVKYIRNRNSYLNEDVNLAKSIINKKMADYEKLKTLLVKNVGYLGKFTEYLMNENIPYSELEKLYKSLISLREKQINVNINALKYEKALDEIQKANDNLSINSLISKFPSDQKKIARELIKEEEYKNLVLKVSKKANVEAFLNKISRYKSKDELINSMSIFCKDPINDRDKIAEILVPMESKVVFSNDNILIIQVENYKDIKILGSDTSWCIVASESTFNQYTKNRYQFIVYNYELDEYDTYFKIGFTINKDGGIYTAHNVLDTYAVGECRDLLKNNGVDIKDFLPKKEPFIFDINKFNSKTSIENANTVIEECDLEILPEVIRKIIKFNRSDETKRGLISKAFKRLFFDKPYILLSDVDKISINLLPYVKHNRRIVDENHVNLTLEEPAILKGLEIWPYKAYTSLSKTNIDCVEDLDKETITLISNKINDIYINNRLKWSDFNIKNTSYRGVKYTKEFETNMLVLNGILGRIEETPDYEKVLSKLPYYMIKQYDDIIKPQIDLDEDAHVHHNITDDYVSRIIKKDYEGIYISRSLDSATKIINHLKGYKLRFSISKNDLKSFISNPNRYNKDNVNEFIFNLISKFNTKRLVSNTVVTDGNVSVRVY